MQGDRVRYFSVERAEWEEVPTALVDFDATKRALEETKATRQKQLEEAKEIEQQRFYKPPDQGMEVAPGIRLPGDDGVFTVDGKRLVRLAVSSGEVVTDKKRAAMVLAVPLPVVKARSLGGPGRCQSDDSLERSVAGVLRSVRRGIGAAAGIGAPEAGERSRACSRTWILSRGKSGQADGRAHHGFRSSANRSAPTSTR